MSIGRKVFHCAVDETALTSNISEIKKWTSQGAITLIVPLYSTWSHSEQESSIIDITYTYALTFCEALERLRGLKKVGSQIGVNAREAVRFLDRVTSGKHGIPASKIVLQGPTEQFEEWDIVEKFLQPEYEEEAYSDDGVEGDVSQSVEDSNEAQTNPPKEAQYANEMSQMLLNKLNFKKEVDGTSFTSNSLPTSPGTGSSRTSPEYANADLASGKQAPNGGHRAENPHKRSASGSVIPTTPVTIRPLLSAILWRLHCLPESTPGINSCILLTNDQGTQTWAHKFGIATKNIHQLRTAIIYEEREFKNHCKYMEKNQSTAAEPGPLLSYEEDSDEDELVFVPRGQGKPRGSPVQNTRRKVQNSRAESSAMPSTGTAAAEVPSSPIDPDSFSRNYGAVKQNTALEFNPPSSPSRGAGRGSSRTVSGRRAGARGGMPRGAPRGRGKLWVP